LICKYNFELPIDPLALVEMARDVLIEHGGTIIGDLPNATILVPTHLGQFEGTCSLVSDSTLHIEVTRKPDLITCPMIREQLIIVIKEGVKRYTARTKGNK
jgi:hypothetical protein